VKGAWQGRRTAIPVAFAAAGALLAPVALPEEAPQTGRAAAAVAGAAVAAALALLAASPRRAVSRPGAWGAFLCLALLLGAAAFRLAEELAPLMDGGRLQAMLEQNRSAALWIYAALCFLQPIALPLPEALTVMAGSTVLGAFPAFIAGFAGTMLGIAAMFALARYGGMKVAARLVKPQQLQRYHRFVSRHEWPILVALFVIPVLPDEIVCVGAGISGVAIRRFLTVAALSKLATSSSLAYSVELGALLSVSPSQLLLAVGAVALAALLLPRAARLLSPGGPGGSAPAEDRAREGNGESANGETPRAGL